MPTKKITQTKLAPTILFEDQHMLILSKPAGLLSQGEKQGDDNLVDWLRHYFGRNYVGLIHRLDRNTSGLMVVGKRSKSARRLTEALQAGKIDRCYLAWVNGTLLKPATWQHRLLKNNQTNTVSVVNAGGQLAQLRVTPIRQAVWQQQPITLAEFILETGRSHQIRVQSAHEGYPVLGDVKYRAAIRANQPPFHRLALHSHRLSLPHPMSGKLMNFSEALPKELEIG